MDTFVNTMRIINAVLGALAFLFLFIRVNDDWKGITHGWRVVLAAFLGLLLVLVIGSVEAALSARLDGSSIRVWWAFAFVLVLIYGLVKVRKDSSMSSGWIKASRVQAMLDEIEAEEMEHQGHHCLSPGCVKIRAKARVEIENAGSYIER